MSYHALGAAENETPLQPVAPAPPRAPTIVEIGFPPVRVTVPLTTEERKKEAIGWSVAMVLAAGALLYFGGSAIGRVVSVWRGQT